MIYSRSEMNFKERTDMKRRFISAMLLWCACGLMACGSNEVPESAGSTEAVTEEIMETQEKET